MIHRATTIGQGQVLLLMQRSAARLSEAQIDAASLDRLRRPSAHPADAAQSVRLDADLAAHDALQERLSEAELQLGSIEGALAEASNLLTRARELAVQMASETYDATDRAVAAQEVEALVQQMVDQANTRVDGISLFAGTAVGTPAFQPDGTYVGAAIGRTVPLLGGDALSVGFVGDAVFRDPAADVFAVLDDLVTALQADDTAGIQATLDDLDAAHAHVNAERSRAGVSMNHVLDLSLASVGASVSLEGLLAELEELDAVEAFSTLAQMQTAYEAAAATLSGVLNSSIFDHL